VKTADIRIELDKIILQCKIYIFLGKNRKKDETYATWTITNQVIGDPNFLRKVSCS